MPRPKAEKTNQQNSLPDHRIRYSKYKWEFLRRNPKYIEYWERLNNINALKLFEGLDIDESEREQSKIKPWEKLKEKITIINDFNEKWMLFCPLCPDKNYDELVEDERSKHINPSSLSDEMLHIFVYHNLYQEMLYNIPVQEENVWHVSENRIDVTPRFAESGIFSLKINLNYSKDRLMREFKRLVDGFKLTYKREHRTFLYRKFCKQKNIQHPVDKELPKKLGEEFEKFYKKELRKKQKQYEPKYHFDNFDLYLQVYDLRKEGKSWAEIKKRLNLNSVQTARNHHRSACEVIEKGIDLYVK